MYITLVSIWAWFVLAACLITWLPLMAITRLVTLPFDKGRYWVGYLFRQIGVVTATLNPLWRFRVTGTIPRNPRVLRRHSPDQSSPVGDEMALQG